MFEAEHSIWDPAETVDILRKGGASLTPSLAAQTNIATPKGATAIGDLRPGDLVLTRDVGFREVLWVGRQRLNGPAIHLRAGALRNADALSLSPQQGILIADPRAELMFDTTEVLVPAAFLVDGVGIVRGRARQDHVQIALDGHHMVFAEGLSVETLCFDPEGLACLDPSTWAEIVQKRPELKTPDPAYDRPARRYLDRLEARVLMAEMRAATLSS